MEAGCIHPHKDALASFPDVASPPFCFESELCRPQEFSDDDVDEDIDALMSAHSKTHSRRLSNAVSTVPPTLKLVQTREHQNRFWKSCVLLYSTNMDTHTHACTHRHMMCKVCMFCYSLCKHSMSFRARTQLVSRTLRKPPAFT